MRTSVGATREAVIPRGRFTFKRKPAATKSQATDDAGTAASTTAALGAAALASVVDSSSAASPAPAASAPAAVETPSSSSDVTVCDRAGETVHIAAGKYSGPAGGPTDISLARLTDCVVVLRDATRALRVDKLVRCRVYAAPCAGSVLLHDCSGCEFHLTAVRQVGPQLTIIVHVGLPPCCRATAGPDTHIV